MIRIGDDHPALTHRTPRRAVALLAVLLPFALWSVAALGTLTPRTVAVAAIGAALASVAVARGAPERPPLPRGRFGFDSSLRRIYAAFVVAYAVGGATAVVVKLFAFPGANISLTWPISIVRPRAPVGSVDLITRALAGAGVIGEPTSIAFVYPLSPLDVIAAVLAVAVLLRFLRSVERRSIVGIYGLGVVTVVLTNLAQGYERGYVFPLIGRETVGSQYYPVARDLPSGVEFLARFNEIQSTLPLHPETHPPGAVLLYYYLDLLLGAPLYVGTALALLSLLSVFYLYGLVARLYDRRTAFFVSLLFVLLPAVQIYAYSTIDAFVMFLTVGGLYHYVRFAREGHPGHALLAAGYVVAGMLVTFLGTFLIGIVGLDQFRRNRRSVRSVLGVAAVVVPVALAFALLYVATGFDWIAAFDAARAAEAADAGGSIYALAAPVSYVFTRLESIAEPLLFLTPLGVALAYRGLRDPPAAYGEDAGDRLDALSARFDEGAWFAVYALIGFAGLLVAGVYHTGETGRAAMYVYPFVALAIASHVSRIEVGRPELRAAALLVFGQAVLMQLFGFYFW